MRAKEGNKSRDILKAAVEVFAKSGFHDAKISSIAELAGVATGSIYVYYKNKEDLLHCIFTSLWAEFYNGLKKISQKTELASIDKLDAMIDLVFDLFTGNPSLAIVFVNEARQMDRDSEINEQSEKFLDLSANLLKEGMKKEIFAQGLDLRVFKYFILGSLRSLLHHWADEPNDFQLDKIRRNLKYLIKHGILASNNQDQSSIEIRKTI